MTGGEYRAGCGDYRSDGRRGRGGCAGSFPGGLLARADGTLHGKAERPGFATQGSLHRN